jgi:hypothetical protein
MELIGDIVKRILTKAGRENVYYEGIVKNKWEHIVGDFISSNCSPERIYNNILFINCHNAALKQEIFFLKKRLIEKINSNFDKKIIEDIRVFSKWR